MPEPRARPSLAGWVLVVLAAHAAALLGLGQALSPDGSQRERRDPELTVVGQLALADPTPAGPAGAAEPAEPPWPAPPGAAAAGAGTLTWVPVREPEPAPEPEPELRPELRLEPQPAPVPVAAPAPAPVPVSQPLPPPEPPSVPAPDASQPPSPVVTQAAEPAEPAEAVASVSATPPPAPPHTGASPVQDRSAMQPNALPESLPPTADRSAAAGEGAVVGAADGAMAAPPFEWPPSTRLRYRLTGQYRGDIEGRAQVEWRRDGDRYAVHLDIRVGLPMAPLMSRRMSSEGRLTPAGLSPERYDERTRVALRDPREATLRIGPEGVQMADGRRLPAPPGVQDTASQFIQLAYRFSTEPGLLAAGRTVDMPLALPRRVDSWVYDVVGPERLDTPFGPIEAVHLKPRPVPRAGEVLTAEIWFAPRLRHLPVRIRIQQGPEVYVDLLIDRLPDVLAAPALTPAASR